MDSNALRNQPALDAGQVLDLISQAIKRRKTVGGRPREHRRIVSECLQLAGVAPSVADQVQGRRLRDMYASRDLPIPLTLGAAVALDAAQRFEWVGYSDEAILQQAAAIASHLPRLVSDRVIAVSLSPSAPEAQPEQQRAVITARVLHSEQR
jgi:hypothetical protein